MDPSQKSNAADSPADKSTQIQRKKRNRTSEEIGANVNCSSSFTGKSDGDDYQKESTAELDSDVHAHRRPQQRRLSSANDVSQIRGRKIKQLRLEAIFHPKFENETSEKDVRKEMLSKVGDGEGFLEVTLKHSGSLLLWSGGSRFYSKNDANNMVTLVGEYLLRHHMEVVWKNKINDDEDDCGSKYDKCSDYLHKHRLTLAFEVVTSVLGDHGDIPKKPYLILLSAADRNTQKFFASQQLIDFAQTFRLPHNDYWMFTNPRSCEKLFKFYDDIREIGTADTVIKGLDKLLDCIDVDGGSRSHKIVSMYPHSEYQGNILEGLVVRFVEYNEATQSRSNYTNENCIQTLQELACKASTHLDIMSNAEANNSNKADCLKNYFTSDDHQYKDPEHELRLHLEQQNQQKLTRVTGTERKGQWETSSLILSSLCSGDEMLDYETRQILQLIQTLNDLGVKVEYKLYSESEQQVHNSIESSQQQRWVCIVHVINDETFKKYNNRVQKIDSMQLFRGFSFELVFGELDVNDQDAIDSIRVSAPITTCSIRSNPLMLKMKFLPYMVRTFGCRNGLQVLSRSGVDHYERYTIDLLKKWGISHTSIKRWQPYLYNWGLYAESILKQQNACGQKEEAGGSHQLNGNTYLEHLATFNSLYSSGELTVANRSKSRFHGLVIVVSLREETSSALGDFLSSKLGINNRRNDTGAITEAEMLSTICADAMLCTTIVTGSQKPIKRLLKKESRYAESIFIVLFGCNQEDIDGHYDIGSNDHKKVTGIVKGWSGLQCRDVFHLQSTTLDFDTNKEVDEIIDRLMNLSGLDKEHDKRPGILLFFPGIPGSGKSTVCCQVDNNIESSINQLIAREKGRDQPPRPVIVCEGDNVKGKYWPYVLRDRLNNIESIYLADKNATPNVWDTIRDICTKSHAFSVAVLPDSLALSTVKVMHSNKESCYPFSLAYLAVCMLRVLRRPTHIGKLDESTDHAMLVVVRFYSFYRDIAAEQFVSSNSSFSNVGNSTITIPFFNAANHKELPDELHDCLIDALHFQHSAEKNHKATKSDEAANLLEARLRNMVSKYQTFLESLCAAESETRQSFVKQLSHLALVLSDIKAVDDVQQERHQLKFINIASIDIDKAQIDNVLEKSAKEYDEVKCFLTLVGRQLSGEDHQASHSLDVAAASEGAFVEKPHITMAHFSQLSQINIFNEFNHVDGQSIMVTLTGILIGESIAAFSVRLPEYLDCKKSCATPSCQNKFPHLTVWVRSDESAAKSNDLPSMVAEGEAIRVEFRQSIDVPGKFCFWHI